MKIIYSSSLLLFAFGSINAQSVLSNGFGTGTALINGTTYQKTANIGTGNFGNVAASADGAFFYASGANTTAGTIYYISTSANAITDSVTITAAGGDMSSTNNPQTLFSLGSSAVYRINPQNKSIDSIVIAGNANRIEERPNAKEAWVAADSMIFIIDYSSALSAGTPIDFSSGKFDNSDVRFTKGGSAAYKAATSLKKIYKIDCTSKTIVDSIDTSPVSPFSIEVSTDSSTIYVANNKAVYMYSTGSKTLVDSMIATKQVMNMYRHPTRQELWAVHHFNDSVTVFNETNKAVIASFDIGNDPFFLAFSTGTGDIAGITTSGSIKLYPNPVQTSLTIDLPGNGSKTITVFDYSGRRITTTSTNNNRAVLNVAAYSAGNYFVVVSGDTYTIATSSFIKE